MSVSLVIDLLRCPLCRQDLVVHDQVVCPDGHAFDIARQGYLTLAAGQLRHPGDTAPMVMARQRVQDDGIFADVAQAVNEMLPPHATTLVDVGAGTGYYGAAALRTRPGCRAIALDSSKPALKRAARTHERMVAVGCDLVDGLPIRDGSIGAATIAFAPRDPEGCARMLQRGGVLVVATPEPGHLSEISGPMEMLGIPQGKAADVIASLADHFELAQATRVLSRPSVGRERIGDLVLMGPAGFHAAPEQIAARAKALPQDHMTVTIDVSITAFVRR